MVLGACAALPAEARDRQYVLEPTSDWVLDYAAERCTLVRRFGTGDEDPVYADFDRLGNPRDPSYIAGQGGDGQTQQGQGQGQGTNNQSLVPYSDVYQDFFDYAQTSLDRSYVPLDVKDYVRDYFSSLNPGAE